MKSGIISQAVTVLATAGSWSSIAWQCPSKGIVVGIQLNYRVIAVGTSGDAAFMCGVYSRAMSGSSVGPGLGLAPDPPVTCYAMLQDTAKLTATFQEKCAGSVYVMTKIPMTPPAQIFLCAFWDGATGSISSAVIQFQQD